jgi:hypothetical protein
MPAHTTALYMATTKNIDVIYIQEPWTYPGSKTQNYPGYNYYTPTNS